MRIGLTIFATDETIDPVELGRAAEAAGFDSLWLPEHTHIPVSRESPWPGGEELPRRYYRTWDPFVALTAVAAATTTLRVGTAIALMTERDPIVTAKVVASLDRLSGGRFELGVGAGWNEEEMRNHGTDPRRRFAVMRERVLAMQAIWTRDEAEFHGEHVDFDPIYCWPKPVQDPLPVLMGGNGPKAHDRVLEYATEWMPNTKKLDTLGERIADLRRRGEEAGRGRIPVTYFGARPQDLPTLEAAGVDRVLVSLPEGPADEVLPLLSTLKT
jgi:probable F420-dependent oxidoreductase